MCWFEYEDRLYNLSAASSIYIDRDIIYLTMKYSDSAEDMEIECADEEDAEEAFNKIKKLLKIQKRNT